MMTHVRRLGIRFIFLSLALSAAEPDAGKPVPDARFGNVLYRTPEAALWTATDAADRRVFAAKLPPPDFCTLTVFAGGPLTGDFAAAFERAVATSLREKQADMIERDGGAQPSKATEGFPVLQRVVVAESPQFHTYHWFLGAHSGGRFDLIAFQASSEEMFQRYGQAAANFFHSVKLANSLPPSVTTAVASAPATATAAPIEAAATPSFGPVKVGDHVEVPYGGSWVPGIVTHIEGLTYFVHFIEEKHEDKDDDFFTPNLVRPAGSQQTLAEIFHGTMPDPAGGPVPIGGEIEYQDRTWVRARVARRLGERYVIFTDQPGRVTEQWVWPDQIRRAGDIQPLAPAHGTPRKALVATDVRAGDLVEAKPRRGFWGELTVLARRGDSAFVKIAPNSGLSMRGWVDFAHLRPVGTNEPFMPEDLNFFVGRWRLTGDSFQTLVDRRVSGGKVTETYQNNSGAGQGAGMVVLKADGTYELSNTVVYHDGKGRWERNPNQDEGGILLRGADAKGAKDCVMTNHLDGYGYFQGSIRGPGKWCTRVP